MKILSKKSVDRLRHEFRKDFEICKLDFDEIVENFGLHLHESKFEFNTPELKFPEGKSQVDNMDFDNTITIFDANRSLSPSFASDERLWVTICFREYKEYSLLRWPLNEQPKPNRDHMFCNSNRGRVSDNSLARLWWIGHIIYSSDNDNFSTNLKNILENTDFRSALIERPTTARFKRILLCILKLKRDFEKKRMPYKRNSFREFMKKIDFLMGTTEFAALDDNSLYDLLFKEYKKTYK